jgi:hypothetical protein
VKLSVILEAIDRVTKPVNAIAKRVSRLNGELGLARIADAGKKVGMAFGNAAKEAREMATRVTAAVGIVGGGFFALIKGAADAGSSISVLAQKTGLSNTAFQHLAYAAKTANVSQDDFVAGLEELHKKVVAANAGNHQMAANFKRIGVSLRDAHGKAKPTEEVFAQIADHFQKMPEGVKKSALHLAIFNDAAGKLLPLVNQGSVGLNQLAAESDNLGNTLSDNTVAASNDANDSFGRLTTSLLGVRNSIAAALLPALKPLLDQLTLWIAAHRELIAAKIVDFIQSIPAKVKQLTDAVTDLTARFSGVVAVIKAVIDWIGPMNAALIVVAGLIAGKFLIALAQLTLAFGGLGGAMGKTTLAIARFALGPLIETAVALFQALRAGIGIVEAFNIALAANPIGLVITAIAALAAAVYLIYSNWGTIGPWFDKLWSGIKDTFNSFVAWVEKTFVDAILGSFQRISDFISPIVESLKTAIDLGNKALGFVTGGSSATPSVAHGRGAGSLGAANVRPGSGAAKVDLGGKLDINFRYGQPPVVQAQPNDNRVDYRIDSGRVMHDR